MARKGHCSFFFVLFFRLFVCLFFFLVKSSRDNSDLSRDKLKLSRDKMNSYRAINKKI